MAAQRAHASAEMKGNTVFPLFISSLCLSYGPKANVDVEFR